MLFPHFEAPIISARRLFSVYERAFDDILRDFYFSVLRFSHLLSPLLSRLADAVFYLQIHIDSKVAAMIAIYMA